MVHTNLFRSIVLMHELHERLQMQLKFTTIENSVVADDMERHFLVGAGGHDEEILVVALLSIPLHTIADRQKLYHDARRVPEGFLDGRARVVGHNIVAILLERQVEVEVRSGWDLPKLGGRSARVPDHDLLIEISPLAREACDVLRRG